MNPHSDLDLRLTEALEAAPRVHIPANFAARVAARLPAQPSQARFQQVASPGVGRRVWVAGLAILFVAVFSLALSAGPANQLIRLALESVLAAEFIILTLWLTLRPHTLR